MKIVSFFCGLLVALAIGQRVVNVDSNESTLTKSQRAEVDKEKTTEVLLEQGSVKNRKSENSINVASEQAASKGVAKTEAIQAEPYWYVQPLATFGGAVIGAIATLFIANRLYAFQQSQEAREVKETLEELTNDWLLEFRKLHENFWSTDDDYMRVREWIACDRGYEKVRETLVKKLRNPEEISPKEYRVIDAIDRFCAILLRVRQLNDSAPKGLDSNTSLEMSSYIQWWIAPLSDRRPELWGYITKHWPGVVAAADRVKKEEVKDVNEAKQS